MLRRPQLRAMFLALLLVGCANRGMEAPPVEQDGSGGDGPVGGAAGGSPRGTGGGAGQIGTGGAGTGGAGTGGVATGGAAAGGKGGAGGAAGGTATGGITGAGGTAGAAGRGATGGAAGAGTGGAAGGIAGRGGSAGGTAGAGGMAIPMLAYYPFDQTSGPVISDASGNGHNGTAQGTVAFAAGQIGNALNLNNGTTGSAYVSLPANLLQNVTDVTITAWVWVRADQLWVRIFDFGSSPTKYMFLTPHAQGSGVRFSITTGGNGAGVEQQLNGPAPLPVGAWTHVAVVLQGTSNGTLYVNGTSVASSTSIPLRPSALGAMPNDWLGHSEFTDPNFDGEIDDFRIYARALTAADIQTIYTQR